MNFYLLRRLRGRRRNQSGAAFYLFIIVIIGAMAATIFGTGSVPNPRVAQERATEQLLFNAKQLVLAYLAGSALDGSGRQLGEWRLYPDLPIAAGAGADASEPNYDGAAESGGCAFRGWAPGQPVQMPIASMAAARCIGRLPWRELGLAMPQSNGNDDSIVPWVVFSTNLATALPCWRVQVPIAPAPLPAGYGCSGLMLYPWLTVVDARGNVVSNRVAFALIAPGAPLAGQVRSAAAAPSAYLDQLTIAFTCSVPCQPGSYGNANLSHPDTDPTVLIQAPNDPVAAERLGYFVAPYQFNDRVIFVTVEELFTVLQTRARRELLGPPPATPPISQNRVSLLAALIAVGATRAVQ